MVSFLLGLGVGAAMMALIYHFFPNENPPLIPIKYLWLLSIGCLLAALVIYLVRVG